MPSALTQSRANLSTDLIALYKALGGGWEVLHCLSCGQRDRGVRFLRNWRVDSQRYTRTSNGANAAAFVYGCGFGL